jgi:protein-S-isoprenylcysteine O-methyltransferase Ste14
MTGLGVALQFTGLTWGTIGFLYLGRSFGIVAADRGLKVNGPYGLVRHPVYLGHLLTLLGLLIANPTLLNLGLETVIVASVLLRIVAEERVLRGSAPYQSYAAVVPWRLVPGVY